jgi:hypothetical protein
MARRTKACPRLAVIAVTLCAALALGLAAGWMIAGPALIEVDALQYANWQLQGQLDWYDDRWRDHPPLDIRGSQW